MAWTHLRVSMEFMKLNKITTLSIAAVASLSLVACGNDTAADNAPNEGVTVAAAPESTEAAEETGAAEGAAPDEQTDMPAEGAEEGEAKPGADTAAPAPAPGSTSPGTAEDAKSARDLAVGHIQKEAGAEGVVIAQDLEDRTGKWDVDVLLGEDLHQVKVNTADGGAKTDETEKADDEDRAAGASEVTIEKAIDAALADTPGIVEDASWEDDNSQWQVEIVPEGEKNEIEVLVDPATGEVSKG